MVYNYENPMQIPLNFIYNLFGNYHGWFILVILQFYLLHQIFIKFFSKYHPTKVLIGSFVINVVYLSIFNFYTPTTDNVLIQYVWDRGYWLLFLGWIFYFSIAYYLGKDYEYIINSLKKYKLWIYLFIPISISLVIIFNELSLNVQAGSKRLDMILLTFSFIALILLLTRKAQALPTFIELISRYSFGIYLLHWFFLLFKTRIFNILGLDFGHLNIVLYFIIGLFGSIVSVYVINKFNFGKYIVGNVKQSSTKVIKERMYKQAT